MTGANAVRTSDELLQKLRDAASRPLSAKERLDQEVSYVYGFMDHDSDLTREQVKNLLKKEFLQDDTIRTDR